MLLELKLTHYVALHTRQSLHHPLVLRLYLFILLSLRKTLTMIALPRYVSQLSTLLAFLHTLVAIHAFSFHSAPRHPHH